MYHTILAPLTRRQQRRIARLLALALLPLLLVTVSGHAAEQLPARSAVSSSVRLIRRADEALANHVARGSPVELNQA